MWCCGLGEEIDNGLQLVGVTVIVVDGELQKLIAYKGEKAEIRAEDIRAVCTVSLDSCQPWPFVVM